MVDLTRKQARRLFYAIEINLIFWLSAFGGADTRERLDAFDTYFWAIGFIFAAGLQHWAYHNLYKKTKRPRRTKPAGEASP